MAKNSGFNLNLSSLDDLFTTQAEREDAKLEKVLLLPPEEISEFPNHPFQVRMDEAMKEMVQSVRENGVLVPALVRPKEGGGYEMVSGHRRKRAAELAGLQEIPCIVRNLTDDQAIDLRPAARRHRRSGTGSVEPAVWAVGQPGSQGHRRV